MKDPIAPAEHPCNASHPADARRFEDLAVEELRAQGFRVTGPRIQVIRALAETHSALSPAAIHERIAGSGGRIDAVSVYRILSTLQRVGLVHHIGIVDGYYACRASGTGEHAAVHLVCGSCGCVTELAVPKRAREELAGKSETAGFASTELRVEMLGTCGHCRASAG